MKLIFKVGQPFADGKRMLFIQPVYNRYTYILCVKPVAGRP